VRAAVKRSAKRYTPAVKFALCNETYGDWPFERVCADIAACGYDGMEIAPFTLKEDPRTLKTDEAARFARVARGAGLEVVGLHWLLVKPAGLHITTADDDVRRRTGAFLRHLAHVCGAMEGRVMVLGSPRQRNLEKGTTYEEAFARAADLCRSVCETAGPLGVTLALEPLSTRETDFLSSAAETIRLIEAVDHPACRLHLDVKAMSSESAPIEKIIADSAPWLAHFHANDPNLRGPGFGEVDFRPIAAALRAARYAGYVSVEVFDYSPDPQTIARESIRYLREAFQEAS
jgi:sugar phosphate isomerase/epimerase